MELEIVNCIECASTVRGAIPNFERKRDDLIDIKAEEKCFKCGKEIKIRGVKIQMKRRFWGGMEFILRWY